MVPKDTYPIPKERQHDSRYEVHSTSGSISAKAGSSASSRSSRAKLFVQRNPKNTDSDMDQVVQHKVEEGRVTHKRAEQQRRKELSSLITELEHCLPSIFSDGCQPRNQNQDI